MFATRCVYDRNKVFGDCERIKRRVREAAYSALPWIDPATCDLGFDSIDLAVLGVRIEAVFGIDVFREGIVETLDEVAVRLGK